MYQREGKRKERKEFAPSRTVRKKGGGEKKQLTRSGFEQQAWPFPTGSKNYRQQKPIPRPAPGRHGKAAWTWGAGKISLHRGDQRDFISGPCWHDLLRSTALGTSRSPASAGPRERILGCQGIGVTTAPNSLDSTWVLEYMGSERYIYPIYFASKIIISTNEIFFISGGHAFATVFAIPCLHVLSATKPCAYRTDIYCSLRFLYKALFLPPFLSSFSTFASTFLPEYIGELVLRSTRACFTSQSLACFSFLLLFVPL